MRIIILLAKTVFVISVVEMPGFKRRTKLARNLKYEQLYLFHEGL